MPQPSGKLTRLGMAIQELDLQIKHRAGRSNTNADALSRSPLPVGENSNTEGVLATLQPEEETEPEMDRSTAGCHY